MWYAKKNKLTAWWPQAPSVGLNPKPLIGYVDVSTEWEDTSNIIPRWQIYARHPFNHTCSWYLLTPSETLGLAFGSPLFCWFWKETLLSEGKKQKKNDSRIIEPLPIHWLQCPVIILRIIFWCPSYFSTLFLWSTSAPQKTRISAVDWLLRFAA